VAGWRVCAGIVGVVGGGGGVAAVSLDYYFFGFWRNKEALFWRASTKLR
jgi:hypothetical protein